MIFEEFVVLRNMLNSLISKGNIELIPILEHLDDILSRHLQPQNPAEREGFVASYQLKIDTTSKLKFNRFVKDNIASIAQSLYLSERTVRRRIKDDSFSNDERELINGLITKNNSD